ANRKSSAPKLNPLSACWSRNTGSNTGIDLPRLCGADFELIRGPQQSNRLQSCQVPLYKLRGRDRQSADRSATETGRYRAAARAAPSPKIAAPSTETVNSCPNASPPAARLATPAPAAPPSMREMEKKVMPIARAPETASV